MKRKLPLFMAMLLMVSLLCAPLAHAAYAPSPSGEIEIDDPDVPLIELPEIRIPVEPNGAGHAVAPEDELLGAAAMVAEGVAVRVTIYPAFGTVSEVELSKAGLQALKDAGAELKVETSAGKVILSSASLASFDDDITLVIREEQKELKAFGRGLGLKVYVICNGATYYTWTGGAITLYVPAVNGDFTVGSSYSVEQLDTSGDRIRTYVGRCAEEDERLWVVIAADSDYLGYFVTLSDTVANSTAAVDYTMAVSPLASRVAQPEASGVFAAVQQWCDLAMKQVLHLFGL